MIQYLFTHNRITDLVAIINLYYKKYFIKIKIVWKDQFLWPGVEPGSPTGQLGVITVIPPETNVNKLRFLGWPEINPYFFLGQMRAVDLGRDSLAIIDCNGEVWLRGDFTWRGIGILWNLTKVANTPAVQYLLGDWAITCTGELLFRKLGSGQKILEEIVIYTKREEDLPPMQNACLGVHSLFLDVNGGVWGLGFDDGQLGMGQGTPKMRLQLIKIPTLPVIHLIGVGHSHSVFVDFEGIVWSCGGNAFGQLGLGDTADRRTPQKVGPIPPVAAMHICEYHSILVDFEGKVWVFGQNSCGQIGVGQKEPHFPEKVPNLPPVVSVKAQRTHTMFLDVHGCVWVCGRGDQLGLGGSNTRDEPEIIPLSHKLVAVETSYHHSLFLDEDGIVWYCGSSKTLSIPTVKIPIKINGVPPIQQIFVGPGNSILVDMEGLVWLHGHFISPNGEQFVDPPQRVSEQIKIMLDTRVLRTKSARNHS